MTYNVFSGTLNPTQSINQSDRKAAGPFILIVQRQYSLSI